MFRIKWLLLLYLFKCLNAYQCPVAEICVTDLTENDCDYGEQYQPNSIIQGCCSSCVWILGQPVPPPPPPMPITDDCAPPSNCLPDGKYAPVQCKGDLFMGRCFCSDENGNRIFGQMWRDEASEMACACSRKRSELEAEGIVSTLHCTASGDYEPLQCDYGMCWCTDIKTGQPLMTPVLETDMKLLPCYSVSTVGEQYLRRCESRVIAMALINKEQSEHGTRFLGDPTTFCDYDGTYGPYQVIGGMAYCTGLDGAILGSWATALRDIALMNCNCARDTSIYFPERGMTVTEICMGNGNYVHQQIVGDFTYCVDSDGYPTVCQNQSP